MKGCNKSLVTALFPNKWCSRSSFFGNKPEISQKFEKQFSSIPSYFLKLNTSVTNSFFIEIEGCYQPMKTITGAYHLL
ncbi:hypothetical protein HMPREF1345_02663 [Enterococcus faecium TX1337RF]|nr:hypothetical protein HMPREF1345_02663 [Enterococcus faecium TX1337RF]